MFKPWSFFFYNLCGLISLLLNWLYSCVVVCTWLFILFKIKFIRSYLSVCLPLTLRHSSVRAGLVEAPPLTSGWAPLLTSSSWPNSKQTDPRDLGTISPFSTLWQPYVPSRSLRSADQLILVVPRSKLKHLKMKHNCQHWASDAAAWSVALHSKVWSLTMQLPL